VAAVEAVAVKTTQPHLHNQTSQIVEGVVEGVDTQIREERTVDLHEAIVVVNTNLEELPSKYMITLSL
jgi:hypothetical protein